MFTLPQRIRRYWDSTEKGERKRIYLMSLVVLLYLFHYLVFCIPQPFFIEDAGISFAYARNAAMGEGFVGYPGGERVEGFSNPLWTFILSGLYVFGLDPWTSSKILGAVFGSLALCSVYGISRRMKLEGYWIFVPPLMLALSTQFVVWNSSGLENSLYAFLLCTGMLRLLHEDEADGTFPISALCFSLAAITRPEGIMYGVVALVTKAIFSFPKRRFGSFALWCIVLAIPFCGYLYWRYQYFAWELPNTYYAKLGKGNQFRPFSWTTKGWKYINKYLGLNITLTSSGSYKEVVGHGLGYVLPLLGFAMAGMRKWRFSLAMFLMLPLIVYVPIDVSLKEDTWLGSIWEVNASERKELSTRLIQVKVGMILCTAIIFGLLTLGQKGWKARSMLWAMGCSSVFFVLYSGGDWMDQFRWFHIVELFFFPIFVEGMVLFYGLCKERISSRWVHMTWALPSVLFVVIEIANTTDFAIGPETSVNDIHRRVRYMKWVQHRLDVDDVTLLDVDMGAHMYYSGWDIVDIAGLIDVPMAQHSDFNFAFIRHYIFEERNPDFAHCHGGWAKTSRIPKHKEWKQRYLEIPGYPVGGRTLHIGNHIRKDLFIQKYDAAEYPQSISFSQDLRLADYSFSATDVPAGGLLYLYTAWNSQANDSDVQAFVILVDQAGELASVASFQPGYRWYNRSEWKSDELIEGKFRVPIPKDLKEGTYSIRLVVVDHESGDAYGESTREDFVFLPQEIDLEGSVTVVSKDGAYQIAKEEKDRSISLAQSGSCEQVWDVFKKATRHVLRNRKWREKYEVDVRRELALCLMEKSKSAEQADKIAFLQQARRWDRHAPQLLELSSPLAQELDEQAQELFAQAQSKNSYLLGKKLYKKSYELFLDAIRLEPSRSWTRKRLEEARDKYLKIKRPAQKRAEKKAKEREKKKSK